MSAKASAKPIHFDWNANANTMFKRTALSAWQDSNLSLLNTICPVLANSVDPDQLASEEAN